MKKNLYVLIILGAAWGIFEATAGYLLHLFGLRIGWMIWFPAAYFFIRRAYGETKNIRGTMGMAIFAASLKLVNLFFPGRIDMVVNPAVSMILEALSVVLIYRYMEKENPLAALFAGFVWRGLYVIYVMCMPRSFVEAAPFLTLRSLITFLVFENVINATCITAAMAFKRIGRAVMQ